MTRILNRIVDVRADELRALWLGFLFNFVVLGGYYVIRPIRDNIGAERGIEELPWMYTGTLVAMLIANALFSAIVARMSRRRFIPIAYRFFIANLIAFYLAMRLLPAAQQPWVGRVFYVWVSVFNLFVVTVFWAFMTDIFNSDQGKRLFGFISVGGTLGGIIGALITGSLVKQIGALNLLFFSAVLLEIGAQCVRFFPAGFRRTHAELEAKNTEEELTDPETLQEPATGQNEEAEKPIGGGIISGISQVVRSR